VAYFKSNITTSVKGCGKDHSQYLFNVSKRLNRWDLLLDVGLMRCCHGNHPSISAKKSDNKIQQQMYRLRKTHAPDSNATRM
jgi:hypothetical protein